jgi:RNA polymerase sigma factor (TIGR02999 family)
VAADEPITLLLEASGRGDKAAEQRVLNLIYNELRRLADSSLKREARPGITLQTSALVNEAYLRLFAGQSPAWESRAHFYVTAARTMRRILIDHARSRQAAKRDAGIRVDWEKAEAAVGQPGPGLIEVDQALERLAALDARQARLVELRFFGGLNVEETAEVMGISTATVKREWAFARAWLETQLMQRTGS